MNAPEDGYETCYTVTDWYDGPRAGIADFRGEPHLYESEFGDIGPNNLPDTFLLMPVDRETFERALEDYAIFLRWDAAYRAGTATEDDRAVDRPTVGAIRPDKERVA